ncbi:MAG: hypothetical protein D6705_02610 [Deltaproteobacteria bacterium]|nr:MAG: hypothetical protein D6705_02610 [Deltaproteobacteria bacterium]
MVRLSCRVVRTRGRACATSLHGGMLTGTVHDPSSVEHGDRGTVARRRRRGVVGGLVAAVALASNVVRADPLEGEARTIVRDADRPYTVVAGEADAAATVTNPAGLGLLDGVDGVADVAWMRPSARMRGSGAGLFVGLPVFLEPLLGRRSDPLVAFGLGAQYLDLQGGQEAASITGSSPALDTADLPFVKLTAALAVPFGPVLPGLSVGLGLSRLVARRNRHADGVTSVDVGIAYWINRFLAVGAVGRALNQPRTGGDEGIVQPLVLEPEITLRPLGHRALELALGARTYPTRRVPAEPRFRVGIGSSAIEPHGRLLVRAGPVEVFTEVDTFRFFPVRDPAALEPLDPQDAVRLTAGIGLSFEHVAALAGATSAFGAGDPAQATGGVGRVRVSAGRLPGIAVRPRRVDRVELAGVRGDRSVFATVETLDRIASRGGDVLLDLREVSASYAELEEIREAVLRVRGRGGRVVAYVEGGGLRTYFLAAAADRIVAHPHRSLAITGMRFRTLYFADLLRKLGARPEFIRIAEYKAVPESYHRMSASETVRANRRQVRGDVWNHVLRIIAKDRNQDPMAVRAWIDEAPHTPRAALEAGIVDELAYEDELDRVLERYLGKNVRIRRPKPRRRIDVDLGDPVEIAVVSVEGDLLDGRSVRIPLLGVEVAGAKTYVEIFEALRKDRSVRGVVVRCNTPGGSVSAADDIARAIDRLRKEKPVVVSMGTACASGGYYIATAGQYVFADATTLTGSIGIFYPKMDLSGTLALLGVAVDEEGYGKRSKMRSWWKPYGPDERAAAMAEMRASYDVFIGRVARARATTPEDVDRRLARGRTFAGVRAMEVGLVDRYGGMRDAVLRVREMAGLRRRPVQVRFVPEAPGLVARVVSIFGWRLPLPSLAAPPTEAGTALLAAHPVVSVLRQLPASLYLGSRPGPLAIDPEPLVVE